MTLILSGTNGLSDVDGSASTPAIRGTDSNTGIFFPAADTIAFAEGGAEAMRIDSAGNVGIGTSSPSFKLQVSGSSLGRAFSLTDTNSNSSVSGQVTNGTNSLVFGINNSAGNGMNGGGAFGAVIESSGAYPLAFVTNATERARIDSSGNLQINSAGGYYNSIDRGLTIVAGGYASTSTKARTVHIGGVGDNGNRCGWTPYAIKTNGAGNGAEYYIRPVTWSGTAFAEQTSAGVYLTDNATSWSSASDERIKDIIEPITDAANKVASLRAVIGKYKTDDEGTRRTFLIAQDVQAVLPEAVKAQEDEQGTLGLAYTDVIPLLVAAIKEQQVAIQELKAELDTAKARIAALEAA